MKLRSANYIILEPLPDELLISTLARSCHVYGYDWLTTLKELFGIHYNSSKRILYLSIPEPFEDQLRAYEHTPAPYWLSTMTLSIQERVIKNFFRPEQKGQRFPFSKFKMVKSNPHHSLYYCSRCLKEDIQNYGMPYFHILHQVGNIGVCCKHGVRLEKFSIQTKKPILSKWDCKETSKANSLDLKLSRMLPDFTGLSAEYLAAVYSKKIWSRIPFCTFKKFREDFTDYYGPDLLQSYGLDLSTKSLNFENGILGNHKKTVPIIHHLLIWNYLGITQDDISQPLIISYCSLGLRKGEPLDISYRDLILKEKGIGQNIYMDRITQKIYDEFFPFQPTDFLDV